MHGDAPRLAMVAGEASGDLLAELLLGGLRQRWPDVSSFGIGGPRMVALGFDAWWPQHKLAVHGYADALRHYPELSGIRRQLAERLLQRPPSAFIGVDAPDFNLGLEQRLEARGHQDDPLRVSVDLGLARRSRQAHRAQRGPRAVPVSVRARVAAAARHCRDLCRPSAG
jgi:hypothetical protein